MQGTTNKLAFAAYLEGQKMFSIFSEEEIRRGRRKFELAIKIDSDFARAWGHLSYTYSRAALTVWGKEDDLEVAEEYAITAVGLDGDDYTTHWDLAFAYLNRGKFDEALVEYEIALDLYENWTDMLDRKHGLLAEMAEAYTYVGQPQKAIELLQRAKRYPDWYRWNLGCAYYHNKQYDAALNELENMHLKPGDERYVMDVQLFIAAAYAQKGDLTKAKAALKLFQESVSQSPYTIVDVKKRGCFKNPKDEDLLVEGLIKAGLPEK